MKRSSLALIGALVLSSCIHMPQTPYVDVPASGAEEAQIRNALSGEHIWKWTHVRYIDGKHYGVGAQHFQFDPDGTFIMRNMGRPDRSTYEVHGKNIVTTSKLPDYQHFRVDEIGPHTLVLFNYFTSQTYTFER